MCRSRLRCGREIGRSPDAIAASGRRNSGVEMCVSTLLFERIAGLALPRPSVKVRPKSKNVCHPIKRRGARASPAQAGHPCARFLPRLGAL